MIKLNRVHTISYAAEDCEAVMIIKAYFSPRSLMLEGSLRKAVSSVSLNEFLIVHDLG